MTKLTMNIAPTGGTGSHTAGGTPKSTDPGAGSGSAAFLDQNDGLVLQITSFPTGAELAEVRVYSDAQEKTEVGSWIRTGTTTGTSTGLTNIFSVSSGGNANVTLTDVENTTESDRWYKVKVKNGADYWWMDPEVVNKAGGRENGGASWGPST